MEGPISKAERADRTARTALRHPRSTALRAAPSRSEIHSRRLINALLAGSQAVVRFVADRYFPRATDAAIDAMTRRVTRTQVSAAGLVGILLLLPVMTTLVRQAESALADVFRAPPPPVVSLRFLFHAALAFGAPIACIGAA